MDCPRVHSDPNRSHGKAHILNTFPPADSSCRVIQQVTNRQTLDNPMQWPRQWHGQQNYPLDCDSSDAVLGYISHILMEEDIDEKSCMLQDSLDLQMAEKSLYEVLGQKYPPSPEKRHTYQDARQPDENLSAANVSDVSQLSHSSSSSSLVSTVNSIWESHGCKRLNQSPYQQNIGLIPNDNGEQYTYQNGGMRITWVGTERQSSDKNLGCEPSRRKTRGRDEGDKGVEEEERSRKQAATYVDSELRSEQFDIVLLSSGGEGLARFLSLRASLKDGVSKNLHRVEQTKSSAARRMRAKKKNEEFVDVRALLVQCAQAVACYDIESANSLLKEIGNYASPFGDGTQRLAHCFANGLEARLTNTGNEICRGLVSKRRMASEMLKAYQLYLAACPFQRISNVVSNKTILGIAENAKKLHVIDFGILYGFQWPTLIQHLSQRSIKLRITGIDLPQPGFRPAERVEETGRRLANYAEAFHVPFEYHAIAKRWESIGEEELKIDKEEVTVVNCMYRFKNLYDETVVEDSPRDIVINLIKKLNPNMFIHGVINGAHNAPFFVTRFREALFHFSAMFDMIDTIVPRGNQERMVIEKDMFGWEALNSVACEGWERVERPETYKQWQVRNLRAGFEQVPLDRKIVRFITDKVITSYHKDFVMDEVNKWLLQGWKGRFLYALSTWKPA